MTASMHQQVPCTRKKWYAWDHGLLCAVKLAPTLARQMWRHNYVIYRNEYLIFTLSESINPWVYSLQFLFKSTTNSWRYERKCEWVFFSEHSVCHLWVHCQININSLQWIITAHNSINYSSLKRQKKDKFSLYLFDVFLIATMYFTILSHDY